MKPQGQSRHAFTLIDLLVVIALLMILWVMIMPTINPARTRPPVSACQANLKQIGMAWHLYSADNDGKMPGDAGSDSSNLVRDRLIRLNTYVGGGAKLFVCPADTRTPCLWITNLIDANVSYFAGLHGSLVTNQGSQSLFLAGDRNLTGGTWQGNMMFFNALSALSWTNGLHNSSASRYSGNVLFMDGHVENLDAKDLWSIIRPGRTNLQCVLVPK